VPDEGLEVVGDELRAVVGDDPGLGRGEVFAASLQGDFHVVLGHLVFQLPMDDVAAEAVQQAAQVEKRAADVGVSYVCMPMFVRCRGLVEAVAFLAGRAVPTLQQAPPLEDAVDAAGADGGKMRRVSIMSKNVATIRSLV